MKTLCVVSEVFALFSLVTSALAQVQPTCTQSVPVSVMEIDSGDVLINLTSSQFRVTLGGAPVSVVSAQRDSGRRSLVLVLDMNSGAWEHERYDVLNLLKGVGKKHRIAMIAFAKNGLKEFGFDSGVEAISQWLATVEAGQGQLEEVQPKPVGFLDAIHKAAGMLPADEFGSAILAVGPNYPYSPNYVSSKDLQRELTKSGIRLFGLDSGGEVVYRVATSTGGLVFREDESIEGVNLWLPPIVKWDWMDDLVLGQVLTPYRLDLRIGTLPRPDAKWKVEILNQNGKKRSGLHVVFPYDAPYCQGPSPSVNP
jgi:hypothetical protein